MELKTRLNINAVISVITVFVIAIMFSMAFHRVSRAIEETEIAGGIVTTAFESSILRSDYLRTNSERARKGWLEKNEQMGRLLNSALDKFRDPEDHKAIREMVKEHESSRKIFSGIVQHRENGTDADPALSRETEGRLVSQLETRLYDRVLNANSLRKSASRRLWSSLRLAGGAVICVITIVSAAVIINSWSMGRVLAGRIGRLRDGASVIGGGNLDYRIGLEGDDELAQLSVMLDEMTAKLRRSYSDLEKEIAGRIRMEEALREAKEAAEAANLAKSQFLANMSHELRTPMNGFLGILQLLLGNHAEPLEAKQRDLLIKADKAAHSLLRVISDILDLSKIEKGVLSIEKRQISLRDCVSDAVEFFSTDAQHRGIELTISMAENVPKALMGDCLRLRQVLFNLIGNALKFTEQGRVDVRVTAGNGTCAGEREITFTVTDTGIGIPADKKHRLFRPFSQVDNYDTRRYGGTGLGLFISGRIIELMGGTISFESTEGVGSSFSFTVPLGMAEEGVETGTLSEASPPAAAAGPAPQAGEKPLILVAEDDIMASDLIREILALHGLEIELARTGVEAVEMWGKGRYDMIIMDIQMPRMDGFTAARIIREKEKACGGHIPIVAMTAHAFKEDEDRCFAAGMDAYLTKPLDIRKGMELIMKLLKK